MCCSLCCCNTAHFPFVGLIQDYFILSFWDFWYGTFNCRGLSWTQWFANGLHFISVQKSNSCTISYWPVSHGRVFPSCTQTFTVLFAAYKKIACLNWSERRESELVTHLANRVVEQWPFPPPDFVSQCDMAVPYIWLLRLLWLETIASASSIPTHHWS